MKSSQKTILISLVTALNPRTIFEESENQTVHATTCMGSKSNSSSWCDSQVLGLDVKNDNDETIGEVQDLVLDISSGEIIAVVVSWGGFLGISDILSAVPVTSIRYDIAAKSFKTNLNKNQLRMAPQFMPNKWPDYDEDSSMAALHSYRDSISLDVLKPDNSEQVEDKIRNRPVSPCDHWYRHSRNR